MQSTEPTTGETYGALVGQATTTVYKTAMGDSALKWRILKIDEKNDKLSIIADGVISDRLSLKGATGYNNGVLLLHTIGEKLYSCNKLSGVGRSITIADSNWTDKVYKKIPTGSTWTDDEKNYYPKIYDRDWFSQIDGKNNLQIGGSGVDERYLSESEQDVFIDLSTEHRAFTGVGKANKTILPTYFAREFDYDTSTDLRFIIRSIFRTWVESRLLVGF